MGEARRRRKLAGASGDLSRTPPDANPLTRNDLLALAHDLLAFGNDPTVTGVTIIPAEGGAPTYVSAEQVRRPPSKVRH